jgi:2-oxoisovalerate dehydrogenase E2 component (dihydrolipoyl transacylase)
MTSESQLRHVTLADLGEGLVEAAITAVLVDTGAHVDRLQGLVEVETDKSTVEVTSPWSGTVAEILVVAGDFVEVGGTLLTIAVDADSQTS